jgi:Tfp pilus assembly protein PilO
MNARARMIATVVGAVLVVLLAYVLLIRPRQNELTEVKAQVTDEENLTLQLSAELDGLRDLQRNAPRLQAELERIRALVPRDHEVANFMFQVNAAANASGVEFLQMTPELPKTPPEGAALAEVRITMGGSGGYFAIQDFVRRLYGLDRAMRIDILDLTATPEATDIDLSATARIFFELPGAVAGTAPAPATPTTPTAPPAPAPTGTQPAPSPTAATTP